MIIPNIWGHADAVLPNQLDCKDHKVQEEFKAKMDLLVLLDLKVLLVDRKEQKVLREKKEHKVLQVLKDPQEVFNL
jgi:hypothetical protein